jgi:hypothetical protein
MRILRTLFLAVAILVIGFPALCKAADGNDNLRMSYDNTPAEKTQGPPVMQYALAALMALSVLVIICMPARKAQ